MAKIFCHVATVKGSGSFPIDMLRYDRCSPHSETDSGKIDATLRQYGLKGCEIEVFSITDSKRPPWTIGRWESFGWQIIKTETH